MSDCFQDFIIKLKQDDTQAWQSLSDTTGIIINHWAEERKLELIWNAGNGSLLNKNEFYKHVINEFKIVLIEENVHFNNFTSFKEFILNISHKLLNKGFHEFIELVLRKNNKAWNALSDGLKIRICRFLKMEGCKQEDIVDEVFQETLALFAEKMSNGSLEFESSYKLKSYVLKIAQLKLFEKYRVGRKQSDSIWIDEMSYNLPDLTNYQDFYENKEYASYLFKKLERKEQVVLYYYFFEQKQLKEIANQLCISEENCRIIKYRAIRKLRGIVKHNKNAQILN